MQPSSKYKQIIFILGTTACGKTTTAENFKYMYNADVINMDLFYDFVGIVYDRLDFDQLTLLSEQEKYPDIDTWKERWLRYRLGLLRRSQSRTLVVEGATLASEKERNIILSLVDAPCTVLLLEPWNWDILYSRKHGMRADRKMLDDYRNTIEGDYIIVNRIEELTEPLVYQRLGFTDKKWQALKLDNLYGKSLLDLGCSTGWFNMYATSQGVGRYVGVDNQWKQIIKARSDHYGEYVYGDIEEYLNSTEDKFDIVIMASTLHYFNNKEEIIHKISTITQELFVLEIPISEEDDMDEHSVQGQTYTIPTEKLAISWLKKYFKKVEIVGESVPPDGSYRLVFKAWK